GVGTKLKIAFALNRHSTVGVDLVNHCVNDIAVHGAAPLFLLDYLATGKMHPKVVTEVVRGLALACRSVGCALIGGETAEMPGFYPPNEYDLAGWIVGEELLAPHRCYWKVVKPLLAEHLLKGLVHVTGGGITDNTPRILPAGAQAVV